MNFFSLIISLFINLHCHVVTLPSMQCCNVIRFLSSVRHKFDLVVTFKQITLSFFFCSAQFSLLGFSRKPTLTTKHATIFSGSNISFFLLCLLHLLRLSVKETLVLFLIYMYIYFQITLGSRMWMLCSLTTNCILLISLSIDIIIRGN